MSSTLTFAAQPRTALGSTNTKKLRLAGQVPVTVSVPGKDSRHLSMTAKDAADLVSQVVHLCQVKVGSESITVLKGEVVRDVLRDDVQHLDLIAVDAKGEIRVDVAVRVDPTKCLGVKSGGIVEQRLRTVKVRCKADSIPDAIDLDISEVALMETVYADKLTLPKGVTLLTPKRLPVLSVVIPRGMLKKEEEEAAAAKAAEGAEGAAPAEGDAAKAAEGAKPAEGAKAEGAKPAADAKKK